MGYVNSPWSHPHDGLLHSTYQEILCLLPGYLSSSSPPHEALEGSLDLCLALSRSSASVYRFEGLITPGGKTVTHWVCSSLLDRLWSSFGKTWNWQCGEHYLVFVQCLGEVSGHPVSPRSSWEFQIDWRALWTSAAFPWYPWMLNESWPTDSTFLCALPKHTHLL